MKTTAEQRAELLARKPATYVTFGLYESLALPIIPDLCADITTLEAQVGKLAEQVAKACARSYEHKQPFCEHENRYAYTTDGGKNGFCALCKVNALAKEVDALRKGLKTYGGVKAMTDKLSTGQRIVREWSVTQGHIVLLGDQCSHCRDLADRIDAAIAEELQFHETEPCGHSKNFLIGDEHGHFTCTICSLAEAQRDGERLQHLANAQMDDIEAIFKRSEHGELKALREQIDAALAKGAEGV